MRKPVYHKFVAVCAAKGMDEGEILAEAKNRGWDDLTKEGIALMLAQLFNDIKLEIRREINESPLLSPLELAHLVERRTVNALQHQSYATANQWLKMYLGLLERPITQLEFEMRMDANLHRSPEQQVHFYLRRYLEICERDGKPVSVRAGAITLRTVPQFSEMPMFEQYVASYVANGAIQVQNSDNRQATAPGEEEYAN